MSSLGREPQGSGRINAKALQGRQTKWPHISSVAAPRLELFFGPLSWGSRPRLNIFRRSAARVDRQAAHSR
jgi:hypothetical protein